MKIFGLLLIAGLLAGIQRGNAETAPSGAYPTPGAASPLPGVSPSPAPLTAAEAKALLARFQKEQDQELQETKLQNQQEIKDLDASLKARYADWVEREREKRHQYFSSHPDLKREEKRAYIADYKSREKVFLQFQKDERLQRVRAQDVRLTSIKADQTSRLKDFKESLDRGVRPK